MAGAKATKETTFDASIDKVWGVISDYESYPDFVDGVSGIKILDRSNGKIRVEYSLNMIKKLTYILNMEESAPHKLSWSFEKGDIFKVNAGSWELKDLGNGTTGVVYNVEVEVKGFFPGAGMIVKTLTEVNLPNMLKAYEQRAKNA
ncbi:MAG: cyclase [Bdellovibrionales bacterium CG12_big_fil_rev_8_21_14_0_65_38_15]|nr:MAG: cyclase [Bdellovibrionales bacterium CG22_combo_CG10-13_8_21_14_all_38_13]PIQ54387.1 MAG: cyclase [Bdellovibrionales bacterium CG12_big_fil_rev_8_21_14_0_65_38_15]PIR28659.1 MAG: cyclase [Bdellovibrionales bacterium CG11_big_fil_rev_8_21_14_0_20_38_13]